MGLLGSSPTINQEQETFLCFLAQGEVGYIPLCGLLLCFPHIPSSSYVPFLLFPEKPCHWLLAILHWELSESVFDGDSA